MITKGTISDQLRPVAESMFRRVPRQFPVLQIMAEITAEDLGVAMAQARTEALKWVQKRSGKLPDEAWDFADFENAVAGTPSSGVRLVTEEVDYWAIRLDYMDHDVAGRSWITEIAIARQGKDGHAVFGLRLSAATREVYPQYTPGVPGIVRQIGSAVGLQHHGRSIVEEPVIVETEDDVDGLVDLIQDPQRRRPVYVVALPERESDIRLAAISPYDLARKCMGIAHVLVLPGDASYWLSDRVGREFSVFHSAVRTYRPGCDFIEDNPRDHPLALPGAIEQWREQGPQAFVGQLIRQAAEESLRRIDPDRHLPGYAAVKKVQLELRRREAQETSTGDGELLMIAEEEIKELRKEAEEWEALARGEEQQRRSTEQTMEQAQAQNTWLRTRVDELEKRLEEETGKSADQDIVIPDTLEELKPWADKHLPGLVLVTGRAAKAAKNSPYEDVPLAYQAVLLLAREYRDMRRGAGQDAFNERLRHLGLELSKTIDDSRAGEEGDTYFLTHKERRQMLDLHLKKGTSREPRLAFRLYFFWDDEDQQVVIGSMPGHLKTRIS